MASCFARQLTVAAPRGVSRSFDPDVLIAEWQADMQSRVDAGELSPNTATTYSRGVSKFWVWFQGQDTYKSVGPRAIRSWIADMRRAGRKPSGVSTLYGGVRAFFAWAVAERGLAYNPCLTVRSKWGSKRHKRDPLSDAEVLRVLTQPDTSTPVGKRARAMLCLMAYTGARTIEVQRARVGDLSSNDRLKLYVHGKGHSDADEALYLVHPDLVSAMYDWLAVHPRGDDPDAPLFCGLGNRNRGGTLTTAWIRMMVTRHKSLDTILAYAHEVDRDSDPAEGYVDCSNGK